MSRTIASVVIVICIVAVAIFGNIYIKNTCNAIVSGIELVLEEALSENASEVNRLSVLLNENWEKENIFMKFWIGQNAASDIENRLNNASFYAKTKNFEALKLTLTELKETLCRIKESFEPDLQTLF